MILSISGEDVTQDDREDDAGDDFGAAGLEPATSPTPRECASQLRYAPITTKETYYTKIRQKCKLLPQKLENIFQFLLQFKKRFTVGSRGLRHHSI